MEIVTKRYSSGPEFRHNIISSDAPVVPSAFPQSGQYPRTTSTGIARKADQLFKIELALSRMENGDYGYCVRCRGAIPINDLEADPSRIVCPECRKPHT